MGWCVPGGCTTSVPSVIKCSAAGSGGVRRSEHLSRPHLPRNGPTPSPSTTVLERELLATSRNARLANHHRNEDANLILQLGTVVTAALNDIDSPLADCSRNASSSSRPLLPTRQHFVEQRRQENHNNASTEAKPRTNNHILPYQFVLQDHNYGAPPPPTPPLSPTPPSLRPPTSSQQQHAPPPLTAQDLCGMAALATVADQVRAGSASLSSLLLQAEEDSRGSPLSSDEQDEPGPEGEETETAAEGEGDEDSVTRCICDFEHDDGYMICCDKCCVWQHVDCMGIDRSNIPEEYLCEVCQPRRVDRPRARNLQLRKQMHNDTSSSDDETSSRHPPANTPVRRLSGSVARKRPAKREAKKVVKRQRRDSAAVAAREQRVSERRANKRKESLLAATATTTPVKSETKRIGARRRSKGKPDSLDEDTQDCWGNSTPVTTSENTPTPTTGGTKQLRQWIDSYEEAVTNHYSPELRARISSIKVNGVHSDFKVASSAVQRCRTSMQENGMKVLIATSTLHANQPIIEVRGKYMLANQQSVRRGGALSPSTSPYLLLYQLPKEGTEVCVDARTYGNDARFVRRSCKPNAEVRHCIEKGTLHLYLVASAAVERHAEITIKHEEGGARTPCKDCPPPPCPTPATPRNGFVNQELPERPDRRRRGSRRTTSSEEGVTTAEPTPSPPAPAAPAPPPPPPPPPPPAPAPVVVAPVVTPAPTPPTPPTPPAPVSPPAVPTPVVSTPVTRRGPKSPVKTTPAPPSTPTPAAVVAQGEDSNEATSPQDERESAADKRKMTREERKMEAIMKAFERLEKAEQRKQETLARQQQHTRRGGERDSGGEAAPVSRHASREEKDEEPQDNRRKGRRTRGRSSSGASNQATSADESSGPALLSPATPASPSPRTLASPPPPAAPSPEKNTPIMLPNCLGFKFPKTKKVLMNEWLNKPTAEAPVSPVKLESPEEGPIMVGRSGSAAVKKRWLRQAISEESEGPLSAAPPTCSSPNSRAGSPPIGDYVTPLKKRRLARESLSSEQSFTPPTTPASDKEGARSPDLEEGAPVVQPQPAPPAAQIRNAARCVEEAVKVLSADTDFMEQMVGEKMVEAKLQEEVKVVKPESPVEVKEEKPELAKPEVAAAEVTKEEGEEPPLQAMCTTPPPPPTPPSAPSTPSSVTSSSESKDCSKDLTPAFIKRKLSISEYRQRKQREGGEKGEGSEGTTSPTSLDDERPLSAGASPSDPMLEINDIKTEGSVSVGGAYMRWSSEPTLVERQRENLTERLRREFGLFVDEQDPAKAAAAAASKKTAGVVANPSVAITANNKCMLPILPPLEPPALRTASPHNIPLPPCSPPPLHDLLSEPPPPPPPPVEEKTPPVTTTTTTTAANNNHSKSVTTKNTIASTVVQNGPSSIKPPPHGKSLLLGGGVQIKNQTLNKTPVSQNTQINNAVINNKKQAIASSSMSGLHNNVTRPNSS